jgi:ATPase subunit of ABC transporter with duplicated ATPase domains
MKTIKTALAKDGRVLSVLEKDYKKLYEQSQERERLKDEHYRRNQTKKETEDNTGFGGTSRCTSFKHLRNLENQKDQQRKAEKARQLKRSVPSSQRSSFSHPNYAGPEPTDPAFDSKVWGLEAAPKTRNLHNGKYID